MVGEVKTKNPNVGIRIFQGFVGAANLYQMKKLIRFWIEEII
jgi:hypothetical protein